MKADQTVSRAAIDANIPAGWLPLVRGAWVLCAVVLIGGFVLGAPHFYRELAAPCDENPCFPYALSSVEAGLLTEWGLSLELYARYVILSETVLVLVFLIPALIIFWRKSSDWIGILASLAFLFIGFIVMSEAIRALSRAYPALFQPNEVLISVGLVLFMLLFFLFPDGRFAPPLLAYPALLFSAVILVWPFLPIDDARSASGSLVVTALGMGNVFLGFLSQVYRYLRVSSPARRQQTKWVLLGLVSMILFAAYWTVFAEFSTLPSGRPRLLFSLTALVQAIGLGIFPISVVVAMMRYRLWDVDLIVRRTLIYAVLTGSLLLMYFGSVVLLQAAVNGVTGGTQSSPLTIVLSTLLIAAMFNPLRRRVQDFIDRRFYRRKYDAAQTLADFARRARDEVELEQLSAALVQSLGETMQPDKIGLWLRGDDG